MDQNQTDLLQQGGQPPAAQQPQNAPADTGKARPKRGDTGQPPAAPLPEQVELAAPHGFVDEEGNHRFWAAGTIVKAEHEIKLLLERLAPLVGIKYEG
jgi:hypothetical protein